MGIMKSLENLFNTQAEKNRVLQQQILMQQKQQAVFEQYRTQYALIANELALILDKVQAKKSYFMPFDISIITSVFDDYHTDSTMPFCIPWAYMPSEKEYRRVMEYIRDNLRPILGRLYPQYRRTDLFHDIFGIRITHYGIDLVLRREPFY